MKYLWFAILILIPAQGMAQVDLPWNQKDLLTGELSGTLLSLDAVDDSTKAVVGITGVDSLTLLGNASPSTEMNFLTFSGDTTGSADDDTVLVALDYQAVIAGKSFATMVALVPNDTVATLQSVTMKSGTEEVKTGHAQLESFDIYYRTGVNDADSNKVDVRVVKYTDGDTTTVVSNLGNFSNNTWTSLSLAVPSGTITRYDKFKIFTTLYTMSNHMTAEVGRPLLNWKVGN